MKCGWYIVYKLEIKPGALPGFLARLKRYNLAFILSSSHRHLHQIKIICKLLCLIAYDRVIQYFSRFFCTQNIVCIGFESVQRKYNYFIALEMLMLKISH